MCIHLIRPVSHPFSPCTSLSPPSVLRSPPSTRRYRNETTSIAFLSPWSPPHTDDGEGTEKRDGSSSTEDQTSASTTTTTTTTTTLALVLASNSASALRDLVGMSYSSSPPLTRAFFTNMVPDFLVTAGPRWRARGLGADVGA
jgi:hypothetical protein